MPRTGDTDQVTVEVAAPASRVRERVRDVTRMPRWSPEITAVRWAAPRSGGAPWCGARFRGRSRLGPLRWSRTCEVVADRPEVFAWVTLPTWWNGDATVWRVTVTDRGRGRSEVRLGYEVLADAPWPITAGGGCSDAPVDCPITSPPRPRRWHGTRPPERAPQSGRGPRPR